MDAVILKAYELIGSPIDPNLKVPVEVMDIVDFKESDAGETIEYFASPAQDRGVDDIYSADAAGTITYHKVPLGTTTPVSFSGLQSKLETILIEEIMNSKDQTALAAKKDGIIRAMDKEEARLVCNLVLAVASQEVVTETDDDILAGITKMKQLISDFATDYVLLAGSDVMNAIETYDKDNAANFNYKVDIMAELAKNNIKKVVKVIGAVNGTPVLAATKAILYGRDSSLTQGRPIQMRRRKFSGDMAKLAGAEEGATRLINVASTPQVINGAGANTLGYAVYGYESKAIVLVNYRAVAWSSTLL